MDVILIVAALFGLAFCLYLYNQSIKLKSELRTSDQLLRETLIAHDRELADHKESVQELALVTARLESIQSISLTPDNAVPKDMHVQKVIEMSNELVSLRTSLNDMTCKFEESRGKQISERTRLGQVTENFAAFYTDFPYDRKEVKALFQPVDLIYFGDDEIVFIDVKTGGSTLSTKQRRIRDNIKAGRCRFEVHRLDESGYKIEKDK